MTDHNTNNVDRYNWIDTGKGWLILCVLYYHSEHYFYNTAIISLFWIPFFMTCFFFMSGFVFHTRNEFNIRHKIKNIIYKLIWSYIIFTSIILIPKALMRDYDIEEGFMSIIMGEASWYVAALIVAEIILCVLFLKRWKQYELFIILIVLLLCSISLNSIIKHEPWYFVRGISGAAYMILGHLFFLNKKKFYGIIKFRYLLLIMTLYVFIRFLIFPYDYIYNESSLPWDFSINTLAFIIESIIGIIMCYIFFNLFSNKYITYAGKNSLIYYYLNGGVILILSILFDKTTPNHYIFVVIIFMLTNVLLSASSLIINKYLPFLLSISIKNK